MVIFGLHQPFIEIVQEADKSSCATQSAPVCTPRSYHSYRKLVESKGHFFHQALDAPCQSGVPTRVIRGVSRCRVLKKSLSAEAVYDEITSTSGSGGKKVSHAEEETESNERPKTPVRRRHFSGKTPDSEPRKVSLFNRLITHCNFKFIPSKCKQLRLFLLSFSLQNRSKRFIQ